MTFANSQCCIRHKPSAWMALDRFCEGEMQCSYGSAACFLFTQLGNISNTGLLGASSSHDYNSFRAIACARDCLKIDRLSCSQAEKQGWPNVSLQIRVFFHYYCCCFVLFRSNSGRIRLLFMVMLTYSDHTSSRCFNLITYV